MVEFQHYLEIEDMVHMVDKGGKENWNKNELQDHLGVESRVSRE